MRKFCVWFMPRKREQLYWSTIVRIAMSTRYEMLMSFCSVLYSSALLFCIMFSHFLYTTTFALLRQAHRVSHHRRKCPNDAVTIVMKVLAVDMIRNGILICEIFDVNKWSIKVKAVTIIDSHRVKTVNYRAQVLLCLILLKYYLQFDCTDYVHVQLYYFYLISFDYSYQWYWFRFTGTTSRFDRRITN